MKYLLKNIIKTGIIAVLSIGIILPIGSYANSPDDMSSAMKQQTTVAIGIAAIFAVSAIVVANIHKNDITHRTVIYET